MLFPKIQENILSGQSPINYELNDLLKRYHIDKNKYLISTLPVIYDCDNLVENNNNVFDLVCPICLNILQNPKSCSLNNNSHSFCKVCIDKHLKKSNNCPICKSIFKYKINKEIDKILHNLLFKCNFYKEGCTKIISYSEYLNHLNKCEYNNNSYECQVEKYNYIKKNFEKCHYKGSINLIFF